MIDPFNPEDIPDEVLGELSDPDLDFDRYSEDDYSQGMLGPYDDPEDWHPVDLMGGGSTSIIPNRGTKTKRVKPKKLDYDYNSLIFGERDGFTKKKSKRSIPTKNSKDYWIDCFCKKKYKTPTKNTGKWLIFVPEKFIDAAWEQIKDATEQGLLGPYSKCSTLFGRKNGPGSDYVCCVFTYNWKDEEDVMRVREALRDLGFEKPLPYKTDEDTLKGKYAHKGDKKISKYWE